MWKQHKIAEGKFSLKKSPGGITDLEFIVQYLVLKHSLKHPEVSLYPDNIRILEALAAKQLIPSTLAEELTEAYKTMRDHIHERVLQDQNAVVNDDEFLQERQLIRETWETYLGNCE